jgi:phosphoglucosamine mutase
MESDRLFGTSGIRRVVDESLSPAFYHGVAQAIGTILSPGSRVCIATDTRLSRETLKDAIIPALLSSGIDVADLGILPTPALAFLTRDAGFDTGIMLTASHNPPEYNGVKLFNGNCLGYSREQEIEIETVYAARKFRDNGAGTVYPGQELRERYFEFIQASFAGNSLNHNLKIVVDPGNGAASGFASELLSVLGFEVMSLNDDPNGLFPNRSPEPKEDTLRGTVQFLREQGADLAICFDGDADRVVFCDKEGFLGFNEMAAYISRLAVEETGKKTIATTVEAGKLLDVAVEDIGARVIRGRVGDVEVAYLTGKFDAAIGVEGVGVYILPQAGPYPDSIFASLMLLSHIDHPHQIREFVHSLPAFSFEKTKLACPDQLKETVMSEVKESAHLLHPAELNTLDGLRLEFDDSWMLIRASGTEPAIRILAESPSRSRTKDLLAKGMESVSSCLSRSRG